MNRLFRVLHRWKCKTAAQKVALDALRHLGEDRRRADVFLWNVEAYLRGVDAPEREFRDFVNHVLYPVENWGGAARLTRKWYWKTVETLRSGDWAEASHAAGVTARYVMFAFAPLRTGHEDRAAALRRPVEWCLSRIYDDLRASTQDGATPIRRSEGDDWLERLVTSGAEDAHCHLRTVVARFDFDAVIAKPAALDEELKALFSGLLARSAATAGMVLRQAIEEAGTEPPRCLLGPAGLFSLPALPLFWMTRSRAQAAERRVVVAMHREFAATGKIEETLPEDAQAIRDAYELEVLKKAPRKPQQPQPPTRSKETRTKEPKNAAVPKERPAAAPVQERIPSTAQVVTDKPVRAPAASPSSTIPTQRPAPAKETPRSAAPLSTPSPLAAVSGIDAKLIPRLESAGIATVNDLLNADADDLAAALHPQATAVDVAAWQDQARLACAVASLSSVEAQLLVACGVTGPEDLAALSPVELWELVIPVAESPDGRRLLRGAPVPDLNTVTRWIDAAKRPRKAA